MSRMGWERAEDWQEQERYESEADLRSRIFFMRVMVVSVLGFLLGYVILLQQTRGITLQEQAQDNQVADLKIKSPRGVIFDRTGIPLAENLPSFNVTITPAFLPADEAGRQAVFERLSELTGVPITNTVAQRDLFATADPNEVETTQQLAQLYGEQITETLDTSNVVAKLPESIANIVETFSFAQYVPAVITESIPITLARIIEQETVFMPGVRVIPEPVRNYPTGEYTAQLIGFMGPIPNEEFLQLDGNEDYERDDRVGLFGIESSLEELMVGKKGRRTIEVDATGREQRQIGLETSPTAGFNLHLTVDYKLQNVAHQILADVMEERRNTPDRFTGIAPEVEQGVVVVLNAKTSEVLAMVNLPTFDNNRFATRIPVEYYLQLARDDYQPLFNNAIGGQYPPGSVYKMITAAAALQNGIVSPGRQLSAPGAIIIPNRFSPNDPGRAQRFVCWVWNTFTAEGERGEHGPIDLYDGLAQSCDIYFYKLAGGFDQDGEKVEEMGIGPLNEFADNFGFGRIQGIELPAEAPGNNPSEAWKRSQLGEPWSTGDNYNTAIGQGYVTSTPLQIAQMTAAIANGGFLNRPTILHHVTDADGRVVIEGENDQLFFASLDENGRVNIEDESGNSIDPSEFGQDISFDENGDYILKAELLNEVGVDREFIDAIAEGMRQTNVEKGTAAGLGWEEAMLFTRADGTEIYINTAGKTGTAEYCDNIAIKNDWCADSPDEIQPTHSWYVAFAPFEDPEIAVAAFIYNAGEGTEWSGPVVRDVMKAYFQEKFNPGSLIPAPPASEQALQNNAQNP